MEKILDAVNWNNILAGLPGAHILQTWEWGQVKADYGWYPTRLVWRSPQGKILAAAQVLKRPFQVKGLRLPYSVLYIPKGPLFDWTDRNLMVTVLSDLERYVKDERAIFIKIDPDIILGSGVPGSADEQHDKNGEGISNILTQRQWNRSNEQIQFRNTVVLELAGDEADWMKRMKQKTRYNLRLAERKGVVIQQGTMDDLDWAYQAYLETSVRDGFVIRPKEYYYRVWRTFMQAKMAYLLLAEVEQKPIAGLFLFAYGKRAWYLYGMSREDHREYMPNYLLQWEAMRLARKLGCLEYDLWGAPDEFNETDSMYGVFRFKQGLGGKVIRTAGAWDFVAYPKIYSVYHQILPKILSAMRRHGKAQARQEVSL
ncbi:MAG TPA: peptidoglycan bridge formation glycyltransferase FemA/FemB family protein [Anaerolineaceae bacterium]